MSKQIKERPIIFSAAMVNAILENRKTQTRRVLKPQPSLGFPIRYDGGCIDEDDDEAAGVHYWERLDERGEPTEDYIPFGVCPYGQAGDRLWVRETFYYDVCPYANGGSLKEKPADFIAEALYYRADGECCAQIPECDCTTENKTRWRNARFMPRWASRIALEITSVRVERLQEITNADAIAEGAKVLPHSQQYRRRDENRSGFPDLWDSINGKDESKSWAANPFVWIVEFKRIEL